MFCDYPLLLKQKAFQDSEWTIKKNEDIQLSSETNNFLVKNFYQTCCISRSSENMANCVREILEIKKAYNGNI